MAGANSSKGGSAGMGRTNGSGLSGGKPGTGQSGKPGSGAQIGARKFDRVLSSKAIQIGHENGITAEFICKQTAE